MINRAARALRSNFHDRFHRLPPFELAPGPATCVAPTAGEGTDGCMLLKLRSDENIFTDDGAN